jgi:hypothetical protein
MLIHNMVNPCDVWQRKKAWSLGGMLPGRIKTSGLQAGAKITRIPSYSFINHQDHNTNKGINSLKPQFGEVFHAG